MHDEDLVTLGKEIETCRRSLGLSASEVATSARISPAYQRTIERGVNPKTGRPSRPAADALIGIAKALHRDAQAWLILAGYDPQLALPAPAQPAKGGIEAHLHAVREAVDLLNQRGPFMREQALRVLERLAVDFVHAAGGTYECNANEEPAMTQRAVQSCNQHLRAVSYQDEHWWASSSGDRYLENHAELLEREIEITRIFLVHPDHVGDLVPTLERHVELKINTYVLDPATIDDVMCKDFVIYDDVLFREANPVSSNNVDKKTARFTDSPSEIQVWLQNFDELRRAAMAEGGDAERVLARLSSGSGGR